MSAVPLKDEQVEAPWTLEFTPESQVRHPIRLIKGVFADLWAGSGLAYRLFVRNLSGTYRQSMLGFLWILIPTIGQALSWTFLAKQRIINSDSIPGDSFIAFVAIGSILWQLFYDAVQAPLRLTLANQGLITKLAFPRESLVLVAIAEVLFDFLVRVVCVGAVLTLTGTQWTSAVLYLPVLALGLVFVGIGIGLLLTPIGSLYQDVSRTLTIVGPFWMLLTPVVYVAPQTDSYMIWMWINPPAALLSVARDLACGGATEMWTPALFWLAISIPYLLFGLIWYRIAFRIFIERMAN